MIETSASAPAKVILLGEHAVVYDKPSIAVPVSSLRAQVKITQNPDEQLIKIKAANQDIQDIVITPDNFHMDEPLVFAIRVFLEQFDLPFRGMDIFLDSQIPVASGLGSGAAVSTALFRSLASIFEVNIETAQLNNLVYAVEKLHHGTPSGIDNTVIVYEKPVYFQRSQPIERLEIAAPFTLLIADTGEKALTRKAVNDVRHLFITNNLKTGLILDEIGSIVVTAKTCIETGDFKTLGGLMTQNHELLKSLNVSSDSLNRLVKTALNHGALGAKLSGGGQGGNMIALIDVGSLPIVKKELIASGAVHVIQTTIS